MIAAITDYNELKSYNDDCSLVERNDILYIRKRIEPGMVRLYNTVSEINHINICKIYEVYEYTDCAYVIREYANGKTLAVHLAQCGKLDKTETKNIIGQVCDGLSELHKKGIIHRDITLSNIIITPQGGIKLIDFDISRSVKKNQSRDTEILGTAGFAAPEQFGFSQSNQKTDVYAVGILANILLTGAMPDEAAVHGRLGKVISRAINIDANRRYKTVHSFKCAFLNAPDENSPLIVRIFRGIPGYRSGSVFAGIIATVLYTVCIPFMIAFLIPPVKSIFGIIVGELLTFVFPYLLLTNIIPIRDNMNHNMWVSRLLALIAAILVFCLGAFIFIISI